MAHIAFLHPQCARRGGAIQMALQSVHALQKMGHSVTLYTFEKDDTCFPELQVGIPIIVVKKTGFFLLGKLVDIISLAWQLRHVDIIIANNPPMQIVAAIAKIFSLKIQSTKYKIQNRGKLLKILNYPLSIIHYPFSTLSTVWWHHHIPWYSPVSYKNKYFNFRHPVQVQPDIINTNLQLDGLTCRSGISVRDPGLDPVSFVDIIVPVARDDETGLSYFHEVSDNFITKIKGFLEKKFIIPRIDHMIATSQFVSGVIEQYCQRESTVIHPVVSDRYKVQEKEQVQGLNDKDFSTINDKLLTIFSHGRLESNKGIDIILRVFETLKLSLPTSHFSHIRLVFFGTGSMAENIVQAGGEVFPFKGVDTFSSLKSGQFGQVIGVYMSPCDAFGMAPLECQMMDIPTIILDRAGARETGVLSTGGEHVTYFVNSESEIISFLRDYMEKKSFQKSVSNVNFLHERSYFFSERLYRNLTIFISKLKG